MKLMADKRINKQGTFKPLQKENTPTLSKQDSSFDEILETSNSQEI